MTNILAVPTPKDIAIFFGDRDAKVIETATLATGAIQNKTIGSTNTISGASITATSAALTTPVVTTPTVNSVVQGVATGSLTAAQLIAATSPVTLIAAPASGKINIVKSVEIFLDYAAAFTGGSDYVIEYASTGTDIAAFDVASLTGTADATFFADTSAAYATTAGTGGSFSASANAAKAIQLLVTGSAFADGAGSVVKWKIHYETHTLLT